MDKVKSDKYILKKFGVSLSVAFLLITLLISRKSPQNIWPTLLLSFTFYVSALIKPSLLKAVYIILTKFSFVMTWITSRLALFIIFFVLFTPAGLIIRLLRIDLLERKIDKRKESYWKVKEKNTLGSLGYEKQF
jgi:hypothetical protein